MDDGDERDDEDECYTPPHLSPPRHLQKRSMSIKLGLLIGTYFFFSVLVGIGGRKTVIGFWGTFILSILLTPFILAFFILIFRND